MRRSDGDYRPPDDWRGPTPPWVYLVVWALLTAGCLAVLYLAYQAAGWALDHVAHLLA